MNAVLQHPGSSKIMAEFDGERVHLKMTELSFGAARWLAVWLVAVTAERNLAHHAAISRRVETAPVAIKDLEDALREGVESI